ncbi:MAG: glycosyl hydrolase family 2, partial [Bacteroidota bacterium]
MNKTFTFLFTGVFLFVQSHLVAQEISKSFELRYVTDNVDANGETDFKGETAVFDTEQRIEFLNNYASVSKSFYNDPNLDTKVITPKEVSNTLRNLKSQPLPEIRNRISLDNWKYMGYKSGQHEQQQADLAIWNARKGTEIYENSLRFNESVNIDFNFPMQAWRSSIAWKAKVSSADEKVVFKFSERGKIFATTMGFDENGRFFWYIADNTKIQGPAYETDTWYSFKIEFDMAAVKRRQDWIRFNLYINDELVADYVPMQRVVKEGVGYTNNFISMAGVNRMTVTGKPGTQLDEMWGVGYQYTQREPHPYMPETFLDEDFEYKPTLHGWEQPRYNDLLWNTGKLPIVHGSERYAEEDLYLRKKVNAGSFKQAFLNIETLDPGGEVWINGKVAAVVGNRHPQKLDVTRFLKEDEENLIGIKVNHFYITPGVGEIMPHSYLDFNIGWFAGRMSLDLIPYQHIEDVFVYTTSIENERATIKARIKVDNDYWVSFRGEGEIKLFPWFPDESDEPVVSTTFPVTVSHGEKTIEHEFDIGNPALWTPESPNLYKVQVIVKDSTGNPVDDYVLTTGIRTLSQEGGSFRLNGEVSMLNGAQVMGYKGPIEKLATWSRCAPAEWVAKELMMVKKMHGNMLRIHAHQWQFPARGINDPRYAEMADQLGIMLIWCPTAWIRTGRGWGDIDFDGFPKYVRQVYNHPSVVVWEAANHTQSFKSIDVTESNLYCEKVYNTINPVDPSRIISYNSFIRHLHYGNDEGTIDQEGNAIDPTWAWTAPGVTRGNQDSPTGYGKEWTVLRNYPGEYRQSFLDSEERAYFNFEHQESMAQPNWNLVKGKPWYNLHSYEWYYDEGSIGRKLNTGEWQVSQAWQAFGAWEAMKKMRYLDYDGFSWCSLHGGANSATYKKPLIDFMDHAKLAYWANKMV